MCAPLPVCISTCQESIHYILHELIGLFYLICFKSIDFKLSKYKISGYKCGLICCPKFLDLV